MRAILRAIMRAILRAILRAIMRAIMRAIGHVELSTNSTYVELSTEATDAASTVFARKMPFQTKEYLNRN
jgi:hypothetical protein